MNIERQVNLQAYNTLAIEVYANYFVRLESLVDLQEARALCLRQDLPWLLIGGGSNLILTQDFAGLVMLLDLQGCDAIGEAELHCLPCQQGQVSYWRVGAGQNWDEWVSESLQQQAYGLQNLSLIPGTVGAAPIQNIGAYGVDISQVLQEVEVFDFATGECFHLSAADCQLGYRDSIFKRKPDWLVTQVTFALSIEASIDVGYGDVLKQLEASLGDDASSATPQQVRDAVIAIRQAKLPDPKFIPNVGSFFKNPVVSQRAYEAILATWPNVVAYPQAGDRYKLAAGWLIDQLGWKGHRQDGVGVHGKQALVLVREPGSQSGGAELLALAAQIKEDVWAKFGVALEVEPRIFDGLGEISLRSGSDLRSDPKRS